MAYTINDLAKFTTDFYKYYIDGFQVEEIFSNMNYDYEILKDVVDNNGWESSRNDEITQYGATTVNNGTYIIINANSPVINFGALPLTGAFIGDAYFTSEDGRLNVWNGTKWSSSGSLTGDMGDTIKILPSVTSEANLPPIATNGECIYTLDTGILYIHNGTEWQAQLSMVGSALSFKGRVDDEIALDNLPVKNTGDAYITDDTGTLFVYDGSTWVSMGMSDGNNGFIYLYKGEITEVELAALVGMNQGEAYITNDTNTLFIYDGVSWVGMSVVKGDQGDAGKDGTSVSITGFVDTPNDLLTLTPEINDVYVTNLSGDLYVFIGPDNTSLDNWENCGKVKGDNGVFMKFNGYKASKAEIDSITDMTKGDVWFTEDLGEIWGYDDIEWVYGGIIDGEDGALFRFIDTVADKTELDTKPKVIGNAYIVLDTNEMYMSDGIDWISMGNSLGDVGYSYSYKGHIANKTELDAIVSSSSKGDAYITEDTRIKYIHDGTLWVEMGIADGENGFSYNFIGGFPTKGDLDDIVDTTSKGSAAVTLDTKTFFIHNGTEWISMGPFNGEDGATLNINGTIANKAALDNLTDMVKGDTWTTEDTHIMYSYNGTAWVEYIDTKGITGDSGEGFTISGFVDTVDELLTLSPELSDGYIVNSTGQLYIFAGPTNTSLDNWIDCGVVKGMDGKVLVYKGEIESKVALDNLTGMVKGESYTTKDTGTLYFYDGNAWMAGTIINSFQDGEPLLYKGEIESKVALDNLTGMVKGESYTTKDTGILYIYDGNAWVETIVVDGDNAIVRTIKGTVSTPDELLNVGQPEYYGALYITLSDGHLWSFIGNSNTSMDDWSDCSKIIGDDGATLNYKGSILNRDALDALTDMKKGDAYTIEDSGIFVAFNGTEWIDGCSLSGPDGDSYKYMGMVDNINELVNNRPRVKGHAYDIRHIEGAVTMLPTQLYIFDGNDWVEMVDAGGSPGSSYSNIGDRYVDVADMEANAPRIDGRCCSVNDGTMYSYDSETDTFINFGVWSGSVGADGAIPHRRPSVENEAALHGLTDVNKGDIRSVDDTQMLYMYDGTTWLNVTPNLGENVIDFTPKGLKNSLEDIEAITDMVVGDAWVDDTTSILYVYDGESWINHGTFDFSRHFFNVNTKRHIEFLLENKYTGAFKHTKVGFIFVGGPTMAGKLPDNTPISGNLSTAFMELLYDTYGSENIIPERIFANDTFDINGMIDPGFISSLRDLYETGDYYTLTVMTGNLELSNGMTADDYILKYSYFLRAVKSIGFNIIVVSDVSDNRVVATETVDSTLISAEVRSNRLSDLCKSMKIDFVDGFGITKKYFDSGRFPRNLPVDEMAVSFYKLLGFSIFAKTMHYSDITIPLNSRRVWDATTTAIPNTIVDPIYAYPAFKIDESPRPLGHTGSSYIYVFCEMPTDFYISIYKDPLVYTLADSLTLCIENGPGEPMHIPLCFGTNGRGRVPRCVPYIIPDIYCGKLNYGINKIYISTRSTINPSILCGRYDCFTFDSRNDRVIDNVRREQLIVDGPKYSAKYIGKLDPTKNTHKLVVGFGNGMGIGIGRTTGDGGQGVLPSVRIIADAGNFVTTDVVFNYKLNNGLLPPIMDDIDNANEIVSAITPVEYMKGNENFVDPDGTSKTVDQCFAFINIKTNLDQNGNTFYSISVNNTSLNFVYASDLGDLSIYLVSDPSTNTILGGATSFVSYCNSYNTDESYLGPMEDNPLGIILPAYGKWNVNTTIASEPLGYYTWELLPIPPI